MVLTIIKFMASSTSEDLLLTVRLDQEVIYRGSLNAVPQEISYGFSDDEADRCLFMTMSGKTFEHTKIDDLGNIIQDHKIRISDISFDDVPLGHVFTELAVYEHDFNGTQELIQDQFFGEMGCNGTVSLKFSSPVYLWLLENV